MVDHQQYAKLVQAVELVDIALMELRHRRSEGRLRPSVVHTEVKIQRGQAASSRVSANVEFDLRAVPQESDESDQAGAQSPDLEIHMRWRLEYVLDEAKLPQPELPDELVNEFLQRNVPINVWPYIREAVASLTSRMGTDVTPLLLPTLKIVR